MPTSPLQFAQEYEKFQGNINALNVPDRRLLQIMAFYPVIQQVTNATQYRDYVDDYISLLAESISTQALFDMTIEELVSVRDIILSLNIAGAEVLDSGLDTITKQLITQLLYVGAIEQAMPLCTELVDPGATIDINESQIEDLDSFESLGALIDTHSTRSQAIVRLLREIHSSWEAERSDLHNDRIWCLFVEKDRNNRSFRGRMRQLVGKVTPQHGEPDESDTVVFDNQVRTPDDPFVGVAYVSMKAVRTVMKRRGLASGACQGHFSIKDSNQAFTGDSIGLAFGLLTYTQLLKTEITRHERHISTDLAVTGSLNDRGDVQTVNRESLEEKVKRAFFSHLSVLAVPGANLASASHFLEQLAQQYPRRQLQLIAHDRLSSFVNDKNIIQAERICPAHLVAKIVKKVSRTTAVQIPLLVALCLLLGFILADRYLPECSKPWGDCNPQYVQVTKTGFQALNADSVSLWGVEYECESLDKECQWRAIDLDDNGRSEVLFIPGAPDNAPCSNNAHLDGYNYDGSLSFSRDCVIRGHHPADTSATEPYNVNSIDIARIGEQTVIVTQVYRSSPARAHFRFWSTTGEELGWYINSGHSGAFGKNFACRDNKQLLFLGYNNPMSSASLFVISPEGSSGISPPFKPSEGDSAVFLPGNQLHYVLFPRSDVNFAMPALYLSPERIVIESDQILRVEIGQFFYPYGGLSYYLNDEYRVVGLGADDMFLKVRDSLINQGVLPLVTWSEYKAEVIRSITYWTDSGWVTEGELRALEATQ